MEISHKKPVVPLSDAQRRFLFSFLWDRRVSMSSEI